MHELQALIAALSTSTTYIVPQVTELLREFLDGVYVCTPHERNGTMNVYWNKLKTGFRAVNGHNANATYTVSKSADCIVIQHNAHTILMIESNPNCVRNIYLELYSCQFNVETWLERRSHGEFGEDSYSVVNPRETEFVNELIN